LRSGATDRRSRRGPRIVFYELELPFLASNRAMVSTDRASGDELNRIRELPAHP
jgi:hypothetical protein